MRRILRSVVITLLLVMGVQVARTPTPPTVSFTRTFISKGKASFYGKEFQGKRTASGALFNQQALTAAHRWLPFGTMIEVYNPRTAQAVVVTITDRGPFVGRRVLDLSKAAAARIGITTTGIGTVMLYRLDRR